MDNLKKELKSSSSDLSYYSESSSEENLLENSPLLFNSKPIRKKFLYHRKMDYIRRIQPLQLEGNLAENWKRFRQNYIIFEIAAEVKEKGDIIRVNTFLNAIGEEALDLFMSFNLSEESKKKIDNVLKAFDDHCSPKKNQTYERYKFFS